MKLYHGTSTVFRATIDREGLRNPYLTSSIDIASYYAECSVEEVGGETFVLEVEAEETKLRYDRAAMDEPVMVDLQIRDEQWAQAQLQHPEWTQSGYLSIPATEYLYSLHGVASVRYEGVLFDFREA